MILACAYCGKQIGYKNSQPGMTMMGYWVHVKNKHWKLMEEMGLKFVAVTDNYFETLKLGENHG